jgi:hypothetical protein
MSMDLSVWSEECPELPRGLPDVDHWQPPEAASEASEPDVDLDLVPEMGQRELDGPWYYEAEGWLIEVLTCLVEDPRIVPEEVRKKLPLPKHVAYVTLQPIGAGRDGYEMLEKVVRGLAREYRGVWANMDGVAFLPDEGEFF